VEYRIGCSGWSYPHWRGSFYPPGVPAARWLEQYAPCFDTVELNNSFYRLPSEDAVRAWRERTRPGFTFAVKCSRLITHSKRLNDSEDLLATFFGRMRLLGDRLGPVLYQLPPKFARDDERLARFLALLPRDLEHVFEFRDESWWHDAVYALLRAHNASFCIYHMGESSTPVVATSREAYVRFHGPGEKYGGAYPRAQLARWRERIDALPVRCAWVYFNNDVGGHAPRDAMTLRDLVGG